MSTVSCGSTFRMTRDSASQTPGSGFCLHPEKEDFSKNREGVLWLCLVQLPRVRAPEQGWGVPPVKGQSGYKPAMQR